MSSAGSVGPHLLLSRSKTTLVSAIGCVWLGVVAPGCARLLGLDELSFDGPRGCSVNEGCDAGAEGRDAQVDARAAGQCGSHRDCTPHNWSEPAICLDQRCVALQNETGCELILGSENLQKDTPPFVFGVLAPLPIGYYAATRAVDLAVSEFTRMGLKVGGNSALPVAVVCGAPSLQNESPDQNIDHLVNTLGINAVLSSLDAVTLKHSFERLYVDQGKEVFFLSALSSHSTLATIDDADLLWHMLPDSLALGPTIPPLLNRIEAYVQRTRGANSEQPLRLALVETSAPGDADLGAYLDRQLSFNGVSAHQNATNGAYLRLRVDSQEVENSSSDGADFETLRDFAPDVIVAAAGAQFVSGLMAPLERNGSLHPTYVLTPNLYWDSLLALTSGIEGLAPRVFGVGYDAAQSAGLRREFLSNIGSKYPEVDNFGAENFYDASYFLLYAVSAAHGMAQPLGRDVARGFERLLHGPSYAVGATQIPAGVRRLQTEGDTLELGGLLGTPSFDTNTGERQGQGSVWCIEVVDGVSTPHFDVLLYDADSNSLNGEYPCNDDF